MDGDKRVAVAATALFYLLNGYDMEAEAENVVAVAIDTAEGLLTVADIVGRLEHWVTPLSFGPD